MGLFTPAWKSKNKKRAVKAVAKITDQKKLARVALEAPAWQTRKTAVKKITDESILAEIAKSDTNSDVCSAAVWNLTDLAVLEDIAQRESSYSSVGKTAVEKISAIVGAITDLSILANLAKNGKYLKSAAVEKIITAVEKITDQSALAEFAKNSEFESVREAAVKKLTDQLVLADIAKNDKEYDVREAAVEKLTDQLVLAAVAKNDKASYVRKAASAKITDQNLLADILNNGTKENYEFDYLTFDFDNDEVLSIIKKITDKNVLSTIHLSSAIEKMIDGLIGTMRNNPDGYTHYISTYVLKRRGAAESLIALATKMPHLIKKNVWNNIAAVMGRAHEDVYDKTGNSSDCTERHTDTGGINMTFPPYPFDD